jgi:hypothetical protein
MIVINKWVLSWEIYYKVSKSQIYATDFFVNFNLFLLSLSLSQELYKKSFFENQ